MARLLAFNPKSGEFTEFEQETLQDFYDKLECDCFDIASRKVGTEGRRYDIFVDDVGLLKENPIISAIDSHFRPALVGNLVFANHDNEGNTTSLSDDDIKYIKSCKGVIKDVEIGATWHIIADVDY